MNTFRDRKSMEDAVRVLGVNTVITLISLDSDETEKIEKCLEEIVEERGKPNPEKEYSRESLVRRYEALGYEITPESKFWKIGGLQRGRGSYGLQVGQYTHSCHIDTTEIIVLFVVDEDGSNYVEHYADLWLSGPVV